MCGSNHMWVLLTIKQASRFTSTASNVIAAIQMHQASFANNHWCFLESADSMAHSSVAEKGNSERKMNAPDFEVATAFPGPFTYTKGSINCQPASLIVHRIYEFQRMVADSELDILCFRNDFSLTFFLKNIAILKIAASANAVVIIERPL